MMGTMADHPDGQPQSVWQERRTPKQVHRGTAQAEQRLKDRAAAPSEEQLGMDWDDRFNTQSGEQDREIQQIRRSVEDYKRKRP